MTEEIFTREIAEIERRLDDLEEEDGSTEILKIQEHAWAHAVSSCLAIPGLRGLWTMSAVGSVAQAFDQSGNGRTLSAANSPDYSVDTLVPMVILNGTNQRLFRADEAGFDILGNEVYVLPADQGLTIGGWFLPDTTTGGVNRILMGKLNSGNNFSYWIAQDLNDKANFRGTNTGTVPIVIDAISVATMTLTDWNFVAGRFDPSTEGAVFLNGVKAIDVAGIPATLFNSTVDFTVGATADAVASTHFDGKATLCWLSVMQLSDAYLEALYQIQRAAFGV